MAGAHAGGPAGAFIPPTPGRGFTWGAKLLGASMWFFIFYRARKDGPVVLGWRHPWEGHGHGHGHGDHAIEEGHH